MSGSYKKKTIFQIILGVVAGLTNGFFGGGAGTIVVVALTLLFNIEQRKSHATAILIILPLSVVSALVYSTLKNLGGNVFWGSLLGVVVGGVIGAFVLKKISNKWLSYIFSVVMMVAGIKMLFF